ncbi:MAG TPA: PRC-barrel domain-containing protein [Acidimicrobiales bacterium]|nr:PRC-barrel domain-containing protein [Acidimicrobiales bacterium]
MRRLSEVAGTKVMSKASAQKMGKIERILVDVPPRRVTALQVARDELVDWADVSGVGHDAVVVSSEESVRTAADAREERALSGDFDWKGKLVVSDRGNEMGNVVDLELDESSGQLEVVHTTEGRLEAGRLHALGSYCLVVRHDDSSDLPG